MQAFAAQFLGTLPSVEGFILKNRSPSCGIKDAKVYPSSGKGGSLGRRAGMFGGAVRERFPDLPVEEEGRLTNLRIREHFFTAVFALAALRAVQDAGRMGELVRFHTRHKFLLMGLSQVRLRELGRIVANREKQPFDEVVERYVRTFRGALARPFRRSSAINVLLHAFGYFSERLSPGEKAYFLDLLTDYRERKVPLSAPVSVMRAWIIRFDETYLADQALFFPYPEPLASLLDSGKGRDG